MALKKAKNNWQEATIERRYHFRAKPSWPGTISLSFPFPGKFGGKNNNMFYIYQRSGWGNTAPVPPGECSGLAGLRARSPSEDGCATSCQLHTQAAIPNLSQHLHPEPYTPSHIVLLTALSVDTCGLLASRVILPNSSHAPDTDMGVGKVTGLRKAWEKRNQKIKVYSVTKTLQISVFSLKFCKVPSPPTVIQKKNMSLGLWGCLWSWEWVWRVGGPRKDCAVTAVGGQDMVLGHAQWGAGEQEVSGRLREPRACVGQGPEGQVQEEQSCPSFQELPCPPARHPSLPRAPPSLACPPNKHDPLLSKSPMWLSQLPILLPPACQVREPWGIKDLRLGLPRSS